jgi:hypothetical protein
MLEYCRTLSSVIARRVLLKCILNLSSLQFYLNLFAIDASVSCMEKEAHELNVLRCLNWYLKLGSKFLIYVLFFHAYEYKRTATDPCTVMLLWYL